MSDKHKCPNCGWKKTVKVESDICGAMYISRDSGRNAVWAWPACFGLKKYEGCVEWGMGTMDCPITNDDSDTDWMRLHEEVCKRVYLDVPPHETAWLVVPTKQGFDWYDVTKDLEFSEEE